MIDVLFVLLIISWGAIIAGFFYKDYWIAAFGTMFMMVLGAYIIINGVGDINDWLTLSFGAVHIGVGAYIFIRGSLEIYKNW